MISLKPISNINNQINAQIMHLPATTLLWAIKSIEPIIGGYALEIGEKTDSHVCGMLSAHLNAIKSKLFDTRIYESEILDADQFKSTLYNRHSNTFVAGTIFSTPSAIFM